MGSEAGRGSSSAGEPQERKEPEDIVSVMAEQWYLLRGVDRPGRRAGCIGPACRRRVDSGSRTARKGKGCASKTV